MSAHHQGKQRTRQATTRRRLAATLPQPCIRCGQPVTPDMHWDVDHEPPLSIDPNAPAYPAHAHCNRSHGNGGKRPKVARQPIPSGPPPPPTRPVSKNRTGVPLTGEEEPGVAVEFPDPHPNRAGSRSDDLWEYAHSTHGVTPREWQRLVTDRLLEVDETGRYCWRSMLVIVPRRAGKSTLMQMLGAWTAHQGLTALQTSNRLTTTFEVMRPYLRWAKLNGWYTSSARDQPLIEWPDGGRWVGQAANDNLAVGWSVDMGLVDECWDVPEESVTRALGPALSDRPNPLMLMVSTAEVGPSPLMERWRAAAADHRGGVALVQWSAPVDADWRDEEVWRQASPVWDRTRLEYLRDELVKIPPHDFRTQYLCVPLAQARVPSTEQLVDGDRWGAARMPGLVPPAGAVWVVEDWHGSSAAVAAAWPDGQRVCVVGWQVAELEQAWARVPADAARVLAGLTLRHQPEAVDMQAEGRGSRETAGALPGMRRLLATGRLRWDGDPLDEQTRAAVVRSAQSGGLALVPGRPSHVLRAAAWAVQHVEQSPAETPAVF